MASGERVLLREHRAGERVLLREHRAPRLRRPWTGAMGPAERQRTRVSEGRSVTPAAGVGVLIRFSQTTDNNRNNRSRLYGAQFPGAVLVVFPSSPLALRFGRREGDRLMFQGALSPCTHTASRLQNAGLGAAGGVPCFTQFWEINSRVLPTSPS